MVDKIHSYPNVVVGYTDSATGEFVESGASSGGGGGGSSIHHVDITKVAGVTLTAAGGLPVSGKTGQPQVVPAITTGAYTAGHVVGGLLTFTDAFAVNSGVLQSIAIKSKSVQTATMKLYLFNDLPSTTFTNKTAPSLAAADVEKLVGFFVFAAPDSGLGTMTVWAQDGLGKSIKNATGGKDLYGVLTTTGTPNFASATDLTVSLGVIQD